MRFRVLPRAQSFPDPRSTLDTLVIHVLLATLDALFRPSLYGFQLFSRPSPHLLFPNLCFRRLRVGLGCCSGDGVHSGLNSRANLVEAADALFQRSLRESLVALTITE